MHLTDFARKVPEEVGTRFAPILPPVVWWGNRCPPDANRECRHAVLYVVGTGLGGRRWPPSFPADKTVQHRPSRGVATRGLSPRVAAGGPAR
jgi:hypothetical protein